MMNFLSPNPLARACVWLGLVIAVLAAKTAHAQLTIDVTTSAGRQIPIAIAPFRGEAAALQDFTPIIGNNLGRSGLFRLIPMTGLQGAPAEPSEVNFADWSMRQAEALLIGSITPQPDGRYEIRYRLFDVAKQTQLLNGSVVLGATQFRGTAHRVSDEIYEKLTGERGVFSTKVAYVLKRGQRFELQVADADGFNAQTVLSSLEPIGGPKWSPDGTRLAYVSFESRKSNIVVQDLITGQRRVIANFKGDNYAPSWSPDGTQLAVALSRDAVSQIYVIPAAGGEPRRITQSSAIDSGPAFTPDGKSIIFFSDRSGGPQLYSVPLTGGDVKRLTFEGNYNTSPRLSPDGKLVAFVSRDGGGRLRIATLELASGIINVLTDGPRDDSPSFSPNGRTILFESKVAGRGSLGSVSVDGRVKQRLSSQNGDVREPAWGPYGAGSAAK
jgi:TolB protein